MHIKILIVTLAILLVDLVSTGKVWGQVRESKGQNSELNSTFRTSQISKQDLIKVKRIKITGNTVFSDRVLREIVSSVEGKEVTIERILRLRTQLTNYYVDRGYVSSGAFIPSQEYTDGIIEIRVIEGSLVGVEIEGLSHLKESYILSRLPALEKPLKISKLIDSLYRLNDNPLIENLEANLVRESLGKNVLLLKLKESEPFTSQFTLRNSFSPSVGELGGTASADYHLLGYGDLVSFNFTKTDGLTRYDLGYELPFNKYDGRIGFNYTNADSQIIEDPISALDIQADLQIFQFNIRQPIVVDRETEFVIESKLELIQSETFVRDDFSFAFVDGLEDGESQITVLRLIQEYFNRGEQSSIAIRSQFNIGLDLFDATITKTGIDGLYWSWQGQTQWLRKLNNFLLVSSLNVQLSSDSLLPIEQITLGGVNSVKGYRQNLSIGDNGVIGNVELQIPLVTGKKWAFKVIPFVNGGTIWNNSSQTIESNTLFSTGLGLSYELGNTVEARIDYAFPLVEADTPEDFSAEQEFSFFLLFRP